jgi:hypothetical protein
VRVTDIGFSYNVLVQCIDILCFYWYNRENV